MRRALRFLPTFLAVVEAGGVRAATSVLHKTQAAISYDLKQLQDLAEAPLLTRSGRGLLPTEAGRRLVSSTRELLETISAALAAPAAEAMPIRVAAVPGFGRYVAHARLLTEAGERPLELRFYSNDEVMERVRTGAADYGFCFAERVSQTLVFDPVFEETISLIIPPQWGALPSDEPWERMIERRRVVSYDESDFVFAKWFAATLKDPRRRLVPGDHYQELEEVVRAVAAGRGYSIVPLDAALGLSAISPTRVVQAGPAVLNTVFAVCRADRRNQVPAFAGDVSARRGQVQ